MTNLKYACRASAGPNFQRNSPESVYVDLKTRIRKSIHAKCVTQYYDHIRINEGIVENGWRRSGITKAIKDNTRKEDPFEN